MLSKRSVVSNLKKNVNEFIKGDLVNFILTNQDIKFSDLAFVLDLESLTLSFSLNTQFDLEKTKLIYAKEVELSTNHPKYWHYQDVSMCDVINEEHFDEYFNGRESELLTIIKTQIALFTSGRMYRKLPKDNSFSMSLLLLEPYTKYILV